jgi:hypothetical protein
MYNFNGPLDYGAQSFMDFFNQQPSQVKGVWNAETDYNKRYLWTQIYSVFKFTLPANWELNWFRFWLFHYGSIAVLYTREMGWIAYPYGIQKLNLYYQPKDIIVTSPFLNGDKIGRIGVNAVIVKILDDYYGLDDLVTRFATKLSNIDKAIDIALMNTNVAFLFEAESKKDADTIKEAYATATQGNPLVTVNKHVVGDGGLKPFFPAVKSNFIVDLLLQAKRTVTNEFLTKIGIRNANYDKKERLNSQEVNENNDETRSIISLIYANISESFEKLNRLSAGELGLSVEYTYQYEEEVVEDNAEDNAVRNATI